MENHSSEINKFSEHALGNVFSRQRREEPITTVLMCRSLEEALVRWAHFRQLRFLVNLETSEPDSARCARYLLSSHCPYKNLVLQVSDDEDSVTSSIQILGRFQYTLETVWYGANVLIHLEPSEVIALLNTLHHVEELHLDVAVGLKDDDLQENQVELSPENVHDESRELAEKQDSLEQDVSSNEQEGLVVSEPKHSPCKKQEKTHENPALQGEAPLQLYRMDNIRWLSFSNCSLDLPWLKWKDIVPHVEHLFVPLMGSRRSFLDLIKSRQKGLRSLGLVFDKHITKFLQELNVQHFPELRKLIFVHQWEHLPCDCSVKHCLEFFCKLHELNELYLAYRITTDLLHCIVNNCQMLTSITLNTLGKTDPDTMELISFLPNLRHLRLEQSTLTADMLHECKQLTKLNSLEFLSVLIVRKSSFFKKLSKLAPNLHALTLAPLYEVPDIELTYVVPYVAQHLKSLRTLTLSERGSVPMDIQSMLCLGSLEHLHELQLDFDCLTFKPQGIEVPPYVCCQNVRKLVIHTKKFVADGVHLRFTEAIFILTKIKKLYTSLEVLEMPDPYEYTSYDRVWLQEFFDPIKVQYVKRQLVDRTINEHMRRFG